MVLDRLVPEETGPSCRAPVVLSKDFPRKLFLTGAWLTIYQDGKPLAPAQVEKVLGGASLGLVYPQRHQELLKLSQPVEPNLFVFCPGAMATRLPEGYGVPVQSNESLQLTVQWMNLDPYLPPSSLEAEVTVQVSDLASLRSLRCQQAAALTLVEGRRGYWGVSRPDPRIHGGECLHSPPFPGQSPMRDALGQQFQSKWYTPKGSQENPCLITAQLPLPARLVAIQPYFRSGLAALELKDLTQNQLLWQANSGKGLAAPCDLFVGHEYQLRTVYKNPDPVPRAALAMLMLYLEAP